MPAPRGGQGPTPSLYLMLKGEGFFLIWQFMPITSAAGSLRQEDSKSLRPTTVEFEFETLSQKQMLLETKGELGGEECPSRSRSRYTRSVSIVTPGSQSPWHILQLSLSCHLGQRSSPAGSPCLPHPTPFCHSPNSQHSGRILPPSQSADLRHLETISRTSRRTAEPKSATLECVSSCGIVSPIVHWVPPLKLLCVRHSAV